MSSPGFIALDETINTAVALAPSDQLAGIILGVAWAGSLYAVGMIWTALALIDRWRGPHGENSIGLFSVLAALILAAAWPAVLLILAASS